MKWDCDAHTPHLHQLLPIANHTKMTDLWGRSCALVSELLKTGGSDLPKWLGQCHAGHLGGSGQLYHSSSLWFAVSGAYTCICMCMISLKCERRTSQSRTKLAAKRTNDGSFIRLKSGKASKRTFIFMFELRSVRCTCIRLCGS